MKISVCIITNNNYKVLEAIKSVYDFAYEIVLVNTVKEFTIDLSGLDKVKLFQFEWCNDFSKARNYSIKKAKGEWIFIIDSDEILRNPISKPNDDYDIYFARVHNEGSQPYYSARLFKNNDKIFYSNKVHENINTEDFNSAIALIDINHTGYELTKEDRRIKDERNYKIMLEDFKNPTRDFHLGSYEFVYNKDYKKARRLFSKSYSVKGLNDYHRAICLNNIHSCEMLLNYPFEMQLKTLRKSIVMSPFQIHARVNIIEILIQTKQDIKLIEKELNSLSDIIEFKLSELPMDINIPKNYIQEKREEIKSF